MSTPEERPLSSLVRRCKISKFLCCLPLKFGIVVIGVIYLVIGFVYCITLNSSHVKKGNLDGLGFFENLLLLTCTECEIQITKPALMTAYIFKIIFASLFILLGMFLLLFKPQTQTFSLILIPLSLALVWIQKIILMSGIHSQAGMSDWHFECYVIISLVGSTMIQAYCWMCVYFYLKKVKEDAPAEEEKRKKRAEYHKYLYVY